MPPCTLGLGPPATPVEQSGRTYPVGDSARGERARRSRSACTNGRRVGACVRRESAPSSPPKNLSSPPKVSSIAPANLPMTSSVVAAEAACTLRTSGHSISVIVSASTPEPKSAASSLSSWRLRRKASAASESVPNPLSSAPRRMAPAIARCTPVPRVQPTRFHLSVALSSLGSENFARGSVVEAEDLVDGGSSLVRILAPPPAGLADLEASSSSSPTLSIALGACSLAACVMASASALPRAGSWVSTYFLQGPRIILLALLRRPASTICSRAGCVDRANLGDLPV